MRLYEIWKLIMETWGLPPRRDVFNMLMRQYGMPQRHYHTRQHLDECFALWQQHRSHMENPALVALALFWHDAVYVPENMDNEQSSALQFRTVFLTDSGLQDSQMLSLPVVTRVEALIMATKGHAASDDNATCWVNDIDLAILGATRERYDAYTTDIRKEYGWIRGDDYELLRARFMRTFLERPHIYQTPQLRHALEAHARENIARELESLAA